jgi:hypothetical protein
MVDIASSARKPAGRKPGTCAVLLFGPDPCAKAIPNNNRPKTRPEAGSDETGQPSARTLLLRVFGGESPRLWALLPHMESRESIKAVNEKKDRLERGRPADKRVPTKNGGGGPVSQNKQISQI